MVSREFAEAEIEAFAQKAVSGNCSMALEPRKCRDCIYCSCTQIKEACLWVLRQADVSGTNSVRRRLQRLNWQ